MEYALDERIGNPDLFVGRQKDLNYFLKWLDNVKKKLSKSTAILARRKMGKTALLERLFNIIFYRNENVIPFYFEVKEGKIWAVDFCKDFFLAFIYQYIAFKSRKPEYLQYHEGSNFDKVIKIAEQEGLDYLTGFIESVAHASENEHIDTLWLAVREAPRKIASLRKEFIVQMIDEFQFLNSMIYWDKAKTNLADTFASGYMSTAESKVAPLLVSGSWVDCHDDPFFITLLARFKSRRLDNLPEKEAEAFLTQNGIAYSENHQWLDT